MARAKNYNSAIQLVGLGGAGVNIVEAFINNRTDLIPLLKREGIRISCLAIDVADNDIQNLEESARELADSLRDEGIPGDKISLTAKSVKFPTPESMFDFINKYPQYLSREGVRISGEYQPWLASSMDIPRLQVELDEEGHFPKRFTALIIITCVCLTAIWTASRNICLHRQYSP